MLNIAVDGGDYYPEKPPLSGIQRIVCNIIKNLSNLDFYYFGNKKFHSNSAISYYHLPKIFYSRFFLPINILLRNNRTFLGFSGYIPYLLKISSIKKILFIYDLGFLKNPSDYNNSVRLQKQTLNSLSIADNIIVLSDYAKSELLKYYPFIKKSNIIRIYAGIDHLSKFKNRSFGLGENKFFLYVGVIKPSKNLTAVIDLFQKIVAIPKYNEYNLILIGKKDSAYYSRLIRSSCFSKNKNRIRLLENINDEMLARYYYHSTALINLSYEEGFCFPVLEALSFGKPVLVNDLPLYKEYQKYFTNLHIINPDKLILPELKDVITNIPDNFTWSNFSNYFLRIIS